ncbi:hypothetical protein IWX65_000104 [Arthrobacter sp. CAN_A214]|uniref:hypothetical protein n=1 Tax=Arthrobacter sp. CAN_A214 TaxID=2787720 RepID=UPI0018C9685E
MQAPYRSSGAAARRRRRARAAVVLVVLLSLVAGAVHLAVTRVNDTQVLVRERCSAAVGPDSYELRPSQARNAALIAGVAVARGLPARAASIAIAAAIQESGLENIDYGDDAGPDSRGLFQQRPSQGWGTEEQIMDPLYATNAFYDALVRVPGYESLPITEAAQTVQRSALPDAYADHEPEGRAFASALTGESAASLTCVLRDSQQPGTVEAVASQLANLFGERTGFIDGGSLIREVEGAQGWAEAHWAVANANALSLDSVSFSGSQWTRDQGEWLPAETGNGLTVSIAAVPSASAMDN